MKISEKELPSNANLRSFLLLNCSNFKLKRFKGVRVTKRVKQIKFEGVWGELESKNSFQRQ